MTKKNTEGEHMRSRFKCGDCQLCCKLLTVTHYSTIEFLAKPAGERCKYQRFKKGCKIYNTDRFPDCCGQWSCRWLLGMLPEGSYRPDKIGYVIDIWPDYITHPDGNQIPVIQVWVNQKSLPYTGFKIDNFLQEYLDKLADQGWGAIFRAIADKEQIVMFRHKGQWGYLHSSDCTKARTDYDDDGTWRVLEEKGGEELQKIVQKVGQCYDDYLKKRQESQ